ncbi:hypothetical protein ACIBO1_14540 [Micromonospora sp. NPDC049903]
MLSPDLLRWDLLSWCPHRCAARVEADEPPMLAAPVDDAAPAR